MSRISHRMRNNHYTPALFSPPRNYEHYTKKTWPAYSCKEAFTPIGFSPRNAECNGCHDKRYERIRNNQLHLLLPQSIQVAHPFWYATLLDPHSGHNFSPWTLVPSAM